MPPLIHFYFLLEKAKEKSNFFDTIPELKNLQELGQKIKAKGCNCGLTSEIFYRSKEYEALASNPSPDLVARLKTLFNTNEICFGIQRLHTFDQKCY